MVTHGARLEKAFQKFNVSQHHLIREQFWSCRTWVQFQWFSSESCGSLWLWLNNHLEKKFTERRSCSSFYFNFMFYLNMWLSSGWQNGLDDTSTVPSGPRGTGSSSATGLEPDLWSGAERTDSCNKNKHIGVMTNTEHTRRAAQRTTCTELQVLEAHAEPPEPAATQKLFSLFQLHLKLTLLYISDKKTNKQTPK